MVWFCSVLFLFCFAAASPPLVGLLSAFSSLHGMLHSSPLTWHLSSLLSNYFTASPQGLAFPWVIWGTLWVGHPFPLPPQVAVMICSW